MPKPKTRMIVGNAPHRRPAGYTETASLFLKSYPRRAKPAVRPLSEVLAALDKPTAASVLKVLLAHTSIRSGDRPH